MWSYEREQDVTERMQAIKLIRRYISVMPAEFPVSFVRSLIAVASNVEDSFRRVTIEVLRELSLVNSQLVASCYGFKVLVEAVIDPTLQDVSEPILMTILQLVSDPKSRGNIRVMLNQRILVLVRLITCVYLSFMWCVCVAVALHGHGTGGDEGPPEQAAGGQGGPGDHHAHLGGDRAAHLRPPGTHHTHPAPAGLQGIGG